MAVSGDGTQANPWKVTTYAELVQYCNNETEKWLELDVDIDIANEYPNGDMPTLFINNTNIDGKNHKIVNFYVTTNDRHGVEKASSCLVKRVWFANLNVLHATAIQINNSNPENYHFADCKFSGLIPGDFTYSLDDWGAKRQYIRCAFNLKGRHFSGGTYSLVNLKDCYVEINGEDYIFDGGDYESKIDSCYFKSNVVPGLLSQIENSAVNYTQNISLNYDYFGSNSTPKNIFNVTKHPRSLDYSGFGWISVTEENWTNTQWLSEQGFNAG